MRLARARCLPDPLDWTGCGRGEGGAQQQANKQQPLAAIAIDAHTHAHTHALAAESDGGRDRESVSVVQQALWLVSVALVWGATNPLIKRGSEGVSRLPRRSNALATMVVELVYLFTRWQYVVPFAVNMMGSVLFYYALAHAGTTSALHLSP